MAKINKKRIVENTLYSFKEKNHQVFSHDLRVYISGQDVSSWLKGELSITYGNRESYNTVNLELANPHNLWRLTYDNLGGIWRTEPGEYCERAKREIFKWKNQGYINPKFTLQIDKQQLGEKLENKPLTLAEAMGKSSYIPPKDLEERRYRLAVNDCVFSRHDPMRVFMRNPINAWGNGNEGMWVEVFCGFVQDHPITSNFVNGESTLRITGYDIRQLMKKMRVQMNAYRHNNDVSPIFKSSFFADFRKPSFAKHPFPNASLEKTIKGLILGTEVPEDDIPAFQLNGVGEFKIGNIVCYDPSNPNKDGDSVLERWHLLTLFGCNKVPFPTTKDDLWLTNAEMKKIGENTIYMPNKYVYGPEGRYLHFLLPYEGSGAGSLIQTTVDVNIKGVEWTSRWDIIRDFASKLDFQVNVSPSGDILVEFPMYGFTPKTFTTAGPKPMKANKQVGTERTYPDPVGMEKLFVFDKHQIEETLSDEAEDFPTVLQVDGGFSAEVLEQLKIGDGEIAQFRSFIYSPVLVARYGAICEQTLIPFAGQNLKETNNGIESMIMKRLPKLGLIEYMRRMADASHWEGSVVFRPFLFPNRPVWLRRSARIGLITSVTNRWSIGKSASTSFSCHMLMAERYNPETGEIQYRLPTGASDMPISYAAIWNSEKLGTENSSVNTDTGKNTPSTASNDGSPGSTGSNSVLPTIPAVDLSTEKNLYPAFRDALQQTINDAIKQGLAVSVNNAFRTPEEQTQLRNNPKNKYQVGEPWKSLHQYGLAADLEIAGGKDEDFYALADIAKGYGLRWGGHFSDGFDRVHFDWGFKISGSECKAIAAKNKLRADYWTPVWEKLDGTKVQTTSETPAQGVSSSPATQAINMTKSSGTEAPAPAPACEPRELKKSGLANMAEKPIND